MNWQPIKTAPKTGEWILLAGGEIDWDDDSVPKGRMVIAQWNTDLCGVHVVGRWHYAHFDGGYYGTYANPTHWMPLPDPPA